MLAEPQPLYGFIAYLSFTLQGDQTMSTQLLKQYLYLKTWLTAEEGQDLIEYSLIIALIVIAAIVGMSALGTKIAAIWGNIAGKLP
jgi:pilus assembly protein Flp/PilA